MIPFDCTQFKPHNRNIRMLQYVWLSFRSPWLPTSYAYSNIEYFLQPNIPVPRGMVNTNHNRKRKGTWRDNASLTSIGVRLFELFRFQLSCFKIAKLSMHSGLIRPKISYQCLRSTSMHTSCLYIFRLQNKLTLHQNVCKIGHAGS